MGFLPFFERNRSKKAENQIFLEPEGSRKGVSSLRISPGPGKIPGPAKISPKAKFFREASGGASRDHKINVNYINITRVDVSQHTFARADARANQRAKSRPVRP